MKKRYRIKKNYEIASIVSAKKKVVNNNFIIYYQKNKENKTRFAFSVSKKYGKAFERNNAKRRARNIFRKYLKTDLAFDFVVVIKAAFKRAEFEILEKEADFLINLIKKKTKEVRNG